MTVAGEWDKPVSRCPECGAEVGGKMNFCGSCGARIGTSQSTVSYAWLSSLTAICCNMAGWGDVGGVI